VEVFQGESVGCALGYAVGRVRYGVALAGSLVPRQVPPVPALPATGEPALQLDALMDPPDVVLQLLGRPNPHFALVTLVGQGVGFHVSIQVSLNEKRLATHVAGMRPVVKVSVHMSFKRVLVTEAFATMRADLVLLLDVNHPYMRVFVALERKHHFAMVTLDCFLCVVPLLVNAPSCVCGEDRWTLRADIFFSRVVI